MNSYGLTASCFSGALAVCLKCYKTITLSREAADQAGCLSPWWNLGSHILLCCFSCYACAWQAAALCGISPWYSQATEPFSILALQESVRASESLPNARPSLLTAFLLCLHAVPVRAVSSWFIMGLHTVTESGLKCSLYRISSSALNLLSLRCWWESQSVSTSSSCRDASFKSEV